MDVCWLCNRLCPQPWSLPRQRQHGRCWPWCAWPWSLCSDIDDNHFIVNIMRKRWWYFRSGPTTGWCSFWSVQSNEGIIIIQLVDCLENGIDTFSGSSSMWSLETHLFWTKWAQQADEDQKRVLSLGWGGSRWKTERQKKTKNWFRICKNQRSTATDWRLCWQSWCVEKRAMTVDISPENAAHHFIVESVSVCSARKCWKGYCKI